jgi:amino acid adenylation domain-containing protein
VSYHRVSPEEVAAASEVPLGRAIPNTQLWVADKWQRLVPAGVVGELWIGGAAVGMGYVTDAALTSDKFRPDPWSEQPGARVYRTGDKVRRLSNGELLYLGRMDEQVKVRGYRIELGEVETALLGSAQVCEAVVVVRGDGEAQQLVAYVVAADGATPANGELRAQLQQQLPDYMVPSHYVMVEQIPLTPSGKVDRRALPAIDVEDRSLAESYVAPRTPTEEIVAGIWTRLLKIKQVGIHDDFFALGGHSLLATQLVARMRKVFHVEVPLRQFFEKPTIAGLVTEINRLKIDGDDLQLPSIERVSRDGTLTLSYAQQRLWFLDHFEPGSSLYNIPTVVRLRGRLDLAALEQSFNEVIWRHESLRTRFGTVSTTPVQVIDDAPEFTLPVLDLSKVAEREREAEARRVATEETQRPFDLSTGPLIRASVLRLSEQEHVLLCTLHHIISDGWSMEVLIRELTTLYEAYAHGKSVSLPELAIQYADYAHWQRQWLQGEVLEKQLSYWKQQLAGAPAALELPTDYQRPAVQTFRGAHRPLTLSPDLTKSLEDLSRREGVTLFMTLLAAFQTLLSRYSASDEIVIGTPIAGRNEAETENLIGFFINTLVLRTDLSGNPTFEELLRRVRDVALGAYAHQDVPFEMLVEVLQPARDVSRSPVFQVMLVLQNAPNQTRELSNELHLSGIEVEHRTAKFDLTLSLTEGTEGLSGVWEYNTDLFEAATIERMNGHFAMLLAGIVATPECRLSELPLLTDTEQQQLLLQAGQEEQAGITGDESCLHELFEAQVERTPEAIAVIYEDQQLNYAELNQRANQLAHYLQSIGVAPGTFVGICLPPSIELVVAVLGVLKAGAAYLPLDPAYPQERLSLMLSVSNAGVVLTAEAVLSGRTGVTAATVVCLDSQWSLIASHSSENPYSEVDADNAAYLIFTSGSTGTPKAAATSHRTYTNLLNWYINELNITAADRVLLMSSISFDLTQKNLFAALVTGARLSLAPAVYDARQRALEIQSQEITLVNCTPSAFYPVVEASEDIAELASLRTVVFGGERIALGRLQRWLSAEETNAELINSYGPTECTDVVSYHRVSPEEVAAASEVSLGRAIPNTQLWVADKWQRLVPAGVVGELWIGGAAVGMGYVTDAALTSDKFRPDPWSEAAGARVYRTGDKVRRLSNGELLYLGRVDEQVKVRGYRIELGEVETALMAHSAVREAVVLATTGAAESRLVAYVVTQDQPEISIGDLRAHLEQRLPLYMIPSVFMMLDQIPLTPSGKVDRRALPVPDQQRPELGHLYVAPRSDLESAIVKVWQEVLGIEKVGVYDNFFDLGGHSLLMVQVHLKLREVSQRAVTMIELFQYPTVDSLVKYMSQSESDPSSLQKVHERAAKQKEALKRQRKVGKQRARING